MRRAVPVFALLLACGDDDAPPPDAAPDAAPFEIAEPTPPALPERPRFSPCIEGYTIETTERGTEVCVPFGGGSAECDDELSAIFPGDTECAPLYPCPGASSGDFAADVPANAIFVKEGALTPRDGTRARPYATFSEALANAPRGAVIALGPGTYVGEPLVVNMRVVGLCPERTIVSLPAGSPSAAILAAQASTVTVERLSIVADGNAAGSQQDAHLVLRNVVIRSALATGISAQGASLDLDRVIVGRVRDDEVHPISTVLYSDASGIIDRLYVHDPADEIGTAFVAQNSEVTLRRSTVVGGGGTVQGGAVAFVGVTDAVIDRLYVSNFRGGPAVLIGSNSIARASDVSVRQGYIGFLVVGGTATLSRSTIFDSKASGIAVLSDAHATITDVAVDHTQGEGDIGGLGVTVDEASATLRRTTIERSNEGALAATTSAITLQDFRIDTVSARVDLTQGDGINAYNAVTIEAERVAIANTHRVGFSVHDIDEVGRSTAHVRDLTITDVEAEPRGGDDGMGIIVGNDTTVEIERVRIERPTTVGISVNGPDAELIARDVRVLDVRSRASDGRFGRGIEVGDGIGTLERVVIERARDIGLVSIDYSSVLGTDVRIVDTAPRACAESDCADLPFGNGIGVYAYATLSLDRFAIDGTALCGAHLSTNASLMLTHGVVRRNPVAVCVETDGYDIGTLSQDVHYEENGDNLQAKDLPVPEAATNTP